MFHPGRKKEAMGDEPAFLTVGTDVSAKYKGAFCEAKIRKVVRSVKCRVTFKQNNLGSANVTDDQIKGTLRVGATIEAKHPERKDYAEATITKVQDCSQYTVVFDDGDITTLRRTALCLKSGRHFAESETLDQLPLTHPEHFSNPVVGGRRGRRRNQDDSSDDEDSRKKGKKREEREADIGKVVCIELGDKKKQKDNWFPGLIVAPTAQDTVKIKVKEDYLVRSFKDGRYYTVPKKEASTFTREIGSKVDNNTLKTAVEKAVLFLDKDELPPHWDRDLLFGTAGTSDSDSEDESDSDSSDDERQEEKDHFVAQLYKFMDDCGTPINKGPTIFDEDLDLYRLFKIVHKLGGCNRVTNRNQWKDVTSKLSLRQCSSQTVVNHVRQSYKKYLQSFEDFYRKLGCTMVNHPRGNRSKVKGRSLIRDKDRATPIHLGKTDKDKASSSGSTGSRKDPDEKKRTRSKEDKKDEPKSRSARLKARDDKKWKESSPSDDDDEDDNDDDDINIENSSESDDESEKPVERERRKVVDRKTVDEDEKPSRTRSKTGRITPDRGKGKEIEKKTRGRQKEDEATSNPPHPPPQPKKRGRKRKDSEKSQKDEETTTNRIGNDVQMQVGDKLKVYYGTETKCTYEAKVVEVNLEEDLYLVHYTGWNTRYDEWIPRCKIQENSSWTPARAKKSKLQQLISQPHNKEKEKEKDKESCKPIRGRPAGKITDSQVGRSNTPSSVTSSSSRTKSPAQSHSTRALRAASRSGQQEKTSADSRRRRLGMIGGVINKADIKSESENESSDSEAEPVAFVKSRRAKQDSDSEPERVPFVKGRRTKQESDSEPERVIALKVRRTRQESDSESERVTTIRGRRARQNSETSIKTSEQLETKKSERLLKRQASKKEKSDGEDEDDKEDSDSQGPRRRGRRARRLTESKDEDSQVKGRDFNMIQIRNELVGFAKAVKSPSSEAENDISDKVQSKSSDVTSTDKVNTESEASSSSSDKKKNFKDDTDDIYEFKEPEPFEFCKLEDRVKPPKRPIIGLFDDVPCGSTEKSLKKRSPKKDTQESPTEKKRKKTDEDLEGEKRTESSTSSEETLKLFYEFGKKSPTHDLFADLPPSLDHSDVDAEQLALGEDEIGGAPLFSYSQRHEEMFKISSPRNSPERVTEKMMYDLHHHLAPSSKNQTPATKLTLKDDTTTDFKSCEQHPVEKQKTKEEEKEDTISATIQRVIAQAMKDTEEEHKDISVSPKSKMKTPSITSKDTPKIKTAPKGSETCKTKTPIDVAKPKFSETVTKTTMSISEAKSVSPKSEIKVTTSRPLPALESISKVDVKVSSKVTTIPLETKPKLYVIGEVKPTTTVSKPAHTLIKTNEPMTQKAATIKPVLALDVTKLNPRLPPTVESSTELVVASKRESVGKVVPTVSTSKVEPPHTKPKSTLADAFSKTVAKLNQEPVRPLKSTIDTTPSIVPKAIETKTLGAKVESIPRVVLEQIKSPGIKMDITKSRTHISESGKTNVTTSVGRVTPTKAETKNVKNTPVMVLKESLKREAKREPRKKALKKTVSKEFVEDTSSDSDSDGSKLVIDKLDEDSDDSVSKKDIDNKSLLERKLEAEKRKSELLEGEKLKQELTKKIKEDEEADSSLNSLLCEETIPGSPPPLVEPTQPKRQETPKVREIPFASMPAGGNGAGASGSNSTTASTSGSQAKSFSRDQVEDDIRPHISTNKTEDEAAPVMDNTPPTTPESSISTISGSPREDRAGSSPHRESSLKSIRDSSEVDMDSPADGTKDVFSEDSLLNVDIANEIPRTRSSIPKRQIEQEKDESPNKKKRRSMKKEDTPLHKRLRHSSGRSPRNIAVSDSDDNSDNSNPSSISHTDALLSSRSPRPSSKYNFCVELDPELDASQRIAILQQKLLQIRKTYSETKSMLAAIERRRKKIRRRVKEASKAQASASKQEVWCGGDR